MSNRLSKAKTQILMTDTPTIKPKLKQDTPTSPPLRPPVQTSVTNNNRKMK